MLLVTVHFACLCWKHSDDKAWQQVSHIQPVQGTAPCDKSEGIEFTWDPCTNIKPPVGQRPPAPTRRHPHSKLSPSTRHECWEMLGGPCCPGACPKSQYPQARWPCSEQHVPSRAPAGSQCSCRTSAERLSGRGTDARRLIKQQKFREISKKEKREWGCVASDYN